MSPGDDVAGSCVDCGGSGILNVHRATDNGPGTPLAFDEVAATFCHACPAGEMWRLLGLGCEHEVRPPSWWSGT